MNQGLEAPCRGSDHGDEMDREGSERQHVRNKSGKKFGEALAALFLA